MTETLKKSIIIHAPVGDVWKALTDPGMIHEYFFGVDASGEWKEGNVINYKGEWKGKPYTAKAKVMQVEDLKLLRHSYWSDMSGVADRPENYHIITYELRPHKDHTHLTVVEENLANENLKQESSKLWDTVFENLKKLVEREPSQIT